MKMIEVNSAYENLIKNTGRSASLSIVRATSTGRFAVVTSRKSGNIGFPCGKIDAGETPTEAAYRELHEETGLVLLPSNIQYRVTLTLEGCNVSVFTGMVAEETLLQPAKGFENETNPEWMDLEKLLSIDSRYKDFNIVVSHMTGYLIPED